MTKAKKSNEAASWLKLAVSAEPDAGALGCVLVAPGEASVATDRHRMHVAWAGTSWGEFVATELAGTLPEETVLVAVGRGADTSRRYPDWRRVIDECPVTRQVTIEAPDHVAEIVAVCDGMTRIRRALGLDGSAKRHYGSESSDYLVSIRGHVFDPVYVADALSSPVARTFGQVDVSLGKIAARFDVGEMATAVVCGVRNSNSDKVFSLDHFFAEAKAKAKAS